MRLAVAALLAFCLLPLPVSCLEWNAEAFSLNPKAVAEAAAGAVKPKGEDGIFFYEEDSYRFDESGAAKYSQRAIYLVLTNNGIRHWATLSCPWQPWRQERPILRARVIAADGTVSVLDPKTIVESSTRNPVPDIYSDSRLLSAPLPNLEVGSVVEQELLLVDRSPLLSGGAQYRTWFCHRGGPVLTRRLAVELPESIPLRYLAFRLREKLLTSTTKQDGMVRTIFEASNVDSVKEVEEYLPPDVVPAPCIEFTTGSSWRAVAQAYSDLAEPVIAQGSPREYAGRILSGIDTAPSVQPESEATTATERARLVATILYGIRDNVRYTGINFGQNAIVPHPPAQTLQLGYGDCKDQASLLVAVLRAAGIRACLALLLAGQDADVLPELPGIGLFNHAIAYLPDDELWIDPTATFCRPGELPPAVQGRRALVIAPDTDELVKIPEAKSSDNLLREVREFRLAESGPCSLVETTTASGTIEAFYRENFERSDLKAKREHLQRYVGNIYLAKSLLDFRATDPRSMAEPFTLTIEASDAARGFTDNRYAQVVIQDGYLLENLPEFLRGKEEPSGKKLERQNEVWLNEPFIAEFVYRIYPPPGFKAADLPKFRVRHLGPALHTRTFSLEADGSITAVVRFDCVKRRYTPAEAAELYAEAQKLYNETAVTVRFEQVGEALLAAGKFWEALQQFRGLSALHPQEARHSIQIARTLLAAGFGGDALLEAERALALEPDNAQAHANLAWVRIHDPFGRMFEPGADLEAARIEYAKAAALDPGESQHVFNLAILNEYNSSLARFGPGSNLEEAVRLYRSVEQKLTDEQWNNLALDLLRLGRFAEIREGLADRATTAKSQALLVAAVAVLEGPGVAQQKAERLASAAQDRARLLSWAAQYLLLARRYPESADLMIRSARGLQNYAQIVSIADEIKSLGPSAASKEESTPAGLVHAFFDVLFSSDHPLKSLVPLLAKSIRRIDLEPQDRNQSVLYFEHGLSELKRLEFPKEVLGDIVKAFVRLDVLLEGPAAAVLCTVPEAPQNEPLVILLNREGPAYRLLDVSQSEQAALAWEILDLIASGQEEAASAWLSFVASLHTRRSSFPDLSSKPIFKELPPAPPWNAEDMRLAAAAILIQSSSATMQRLAVPVVLGWWRTTSDQVKKSRLGIPLARALAALNRNEELLEVTKHLYQDAPSKQRVAELRAVALTRDGKPAEAVNLLQRHPYSGAGEAGWSRLLAEWFAGAGRFEEAVKAIDRVIASGQAELRDYGLRGWYELFRCEPRFRLLEDRQFVLKLASGQDTEIRVLACLLAEAGRTSEAAEAFRHCLELRKGVEPDSSIWLVHGMLAERFGLFETARADFLRVKQAQELYPGASLAALAQKHLERLK